MVRSHEWNTGLQDHRQRHSSSGRPAAAVAVGCRARYLGTVQALLAAGVLTKHTPLTGDDSIDTLLSTQRGSG